MSLLHRRIFVAAAFVSLIGIGLIVYAERSFSMAVHPRATPDHKREVWTTGFIDTNVVITPPQWYFVPGMVLLIGGIGIGLVPFALPSKKC